MSILPSWDIRINNAMRVYLKWLCEADSSSSCIFSNALSSSSLENCTQALYTVYKVKIVIAQCGQSRPEIFQHEAAYKPAIVISGKKAWHVL